MHKHTALRFVGRIGMGLAATLLAGSQANAQTGPLSNWYLTAGNQGHNFIIQGTTATQFDQANTTGGGEYAIAVAGDVRTLGNATGALGEQYNLNFVDTGTHYTNILGGVFDGTTDGAHNYAMSFGNGNVYQYDRDWTNPVVLFAPGQGHLGITYDPTNDSLWVSDFTSSATIADYSKTGTLLSSFNASVVSSEITSLGLDSADGTLWMGSQFTEGTFYQYSKTGTLLQTITYNNLVGQNTLGGEFAEIGGTAVATPEPGSVALFAGLGLSGALFLKRRRK